MSDSSVPTIFCVNQYSLILKRKAMENEKLKFRNLTANEIECRVGTVSGTGVSLLLYKDARCDMALLDEVCGPFGWKREHELINGNLFCTVSIKDKDGNWVSKQDVGVESYTEKEKGQASDAFKRACVNWGIGRELYTAPFIWIKLKDEEWTERNGKKVPKISFEVRDIEYEGKTITYLVIVESKTKAERFKFGSPMKYKNELEEALQNVKCAQTTDELKSIYNELTAFQKNQDFLDALNERHAELSKTKAA